MYYKHKRKMHRTRELQIVDAEEESPFSHSENNDTPLGITYYAVSLSLFLFLLSFVSVGEKVLLLRVLSSFCIEIIIFSSPILLRHLILSTLYIILLLYSHEFFDYVLLLYSYADTMN